MTRPHICNFQLRLLIVSCLSFPVARLDALSFLFKYICANENETINGVSLCHSTQRVSTTETINCKVFFLLFFCVIRRSSQIGRKLHCQLERGKLSKTKKKNVYAWGSISCGYIKKLVRHSKNLRIYVCAPSVVIPCSDNHNRIAGYFAASSTVAGYGEIDTSMDLCKTGDKLAC